MDPSYPPHQMSYSNQQQMWANFYGSTEGTSRDSRFPDSEFVPPHMRQERGWWAGSHWHDGGHFPGHHAPWAPQAPPPRGERPGPGRPRSTAKRERGSRRGSSGLSGVQQFPSSVGDGGLLGGDTKRGPGRPKSILDPNAPKLPGETTKNGKQKRYTCEICQKKFSTGWYVRVHRRSHNGERPYVCTHCGKGFMLPNVLQVHLRKCEKNLNRPGQDQQTQKAPSQVPPSPTSNNLQPPSGFQDMTSAQQFKSQPFSGLEDFNQRFLGDLETHPGHRMGFNPPGFPPPLDNQHLSQDHHGQQHHQDHHGQPHHQDYHDQQQQPHNFQPSPPGPLPILSPINQGPGQAGDERGGGGDGGMGGGGCNGVTSEDSFKNNHSDKLDTNNTKEPPSSVSPPPPDYGATIQHFRPASVSPRKELTNLPDSWQTLPILQ